MVKVWRKKKKTKENLWGLTKNKIRINVHLKSS